MLVTPAFGFKLVPLVPWDFLISMYTLYCSISICFFGTFYIFFRFHLTDTLLPSFITFRDSCLTLPAPIPDEEKKLTYIFIFTFVCGSSKGFMIHQKVRK